MERISVAEGEMNGNSDAGGNKPETEFYGDEIAAFRLPHDGKERAGSVGIEFALYGRCEGGYVLMVENWSRRKGGKNYRVFETFDSIEEMEEKGIREASYTVEIPRKLIERAHRNILAREARFSLSW